MDRLAREKQMAANLERTLDNHRRAFEAGEKRAALDAIFWAFFYQGTPPDWAAEFYKQNYMKIMDFQAKSLDEAFGKPFPKGTNLKAKRKYQQLRIAVLETVLRIKGREPDLPFGDMLFEEVGKVHGISKTVASEIYYKFMKELDRR
jgi:hypothetical protein